MDDNDTLPSTNHEDNSFEEQVVKELSLFHVGKITNLKVGLVNNDSFEVGIWYMNRWLANKVRTNSNNNRDNLVSSRMIMCDCEPNNIIIIDYVPIKANKLGEFTMVSQPIGLILVDWFIFHFYFV